MQLAKLKKLDKESSSAVGGTELPVRSCSSSGVGSNLGMNLSKLRHLTRTASVAKPISIDKSCSHGKKDRTRQKASSNLHDMKKTKLGEWQSVVSVMEDEKNKEERDMKTLRFQKTVLSISLLKTFCLNLEKY